MELLPGFSLTFFGGWWFSAAFLGVNLILAIKYRAFRGKVLVNPEIKGLTEKSCMTVAFVLFQACIVLAVPIPIKTGSIWFTTGLFVCIPSYALYIWTLVVFVNTDGKTPVTTGPYAFSRNPQQLFTATFWMGAGFCMGTWLFLMMGILQLSFAYPGFKAQERYCAKRYGQAYLDYMAKVPRYFLPGNKRRKSIDRGTYR